MIPTNLVDRMKVVSDFDTLILRHMVIEMGVQSLCRPSGAASEILTMFEETFRQDREPLVHGNGHVKRGQPPAGLLEEGADEPAKPGKRTSKYATTDQAWYKAAAKRKAEDPWRTAEWRQEILRWAAEHNWAFSTTAYRSFYEAQHKRSLSDTYCKSTLADMLSRQHAVRRTGRATFVVTEVGKRLAADLGGTQQPANGQPAKTAAVAKKTHSRYAAAGDPFDTGQWRREIFLTAAKNNGQFVTGEYAKSFNASHKVSACNTKIYSALDGMVAKNQLTKLGAGRYRVTGAGRKAAEEMDINIASAATPKMPPKKAAPAKKTMPKKAAAPAKTLPPKKAASHPATPDMLLKYAAEHDGNIFTRDFMHKHHTSPGGTYGTLATLQTEKRVEKVDKGHFRVLEQAVPATA